MRPQTAKFVLGKNNNKAWYTFVLISHTSKVTLKILQAGLQ